MHAISTAPKVNFLIEEQSLGELSYKETTSVQPFDDFVYNFNFDTRLPGDTGIRRIATKSLKIEADTDYVFVLTGTVTAASILVWETPERQWSGSETVLEASAGHVAPSVGEVDIYLAAPGTAPVAGQARGSLAFGERLPTFDIESGDYELIVTAHDDPGAILFTSGTQALTERTSVLFTIQDPDPSIVSAISVRRVDRDGTSTELADAHSSPTRRYFHAAFGTTNLDVAVDQDFAAPVVSDLAFGQLSADVNVPRGESTYTVTQAGNQGVVLFEEDDTIAANTRSTAFVTGPPGDLAIVGFADNRRSIDGLAKLRMTLLSNNFEKVDIYLLKAGTAIGDVPASFPGFANLETTSYVQLAGGNYELTVTNPGKKTIVAGPVPLDLANGGVVELALIDTADPNLLDVAVYDN